MLDASGWRVIQTPFRAPNCNAHAERFVRSIKKSAETGPFRSVSGIFVARFWTMSSTTTTSATIKVWGTI
jgi:hypothetical protein